MFPPPSWDASLASKLEGRDPRTEELVIDVSTGCPHDQRVPPLMSFQILSRKRYRSQGWALFPEYESMCCDDDFGEAARSDGVVIPARELVFQHRHPVFEGKPLDAAGEWENREEARQLGLRILERRRSQGFKKLQGPTQS